jgi:arsenical pump membrane protein
LTSVSAAGLVLLVRWQDPGRILRGISWSIIPLVAGLFVLVEALERTGVIASLANLLDELAQRGSEMAVLLSGVTTAVVSNLANNLPVGLVASGAIEQAHTPSIIASAMLIGVDLGPNLSVTGSLATILWLAALRREGLSVTTWQFLKTGTVVMFPALAVSLLSLMFSPH